MREGWIINYPCRRIEYIVGSIAVCGTETDIVPCEVYPYFHSGLNYKVQLRPMIRGYGIENPYTSDLKLSLRLGQAKIRLRC